MGSWALTGVKGISVSNAFLSKYGKCDKDVERQIGAYFSLTASTPEKVSFWLWPNSAKIGAWAMPHSPPAQEP